VLLLHLCTALQKIHSYKPFEKNSQGQYESQVGTGQEGAAVVVVVIVAVVYVSLN
jgi:hypothetical protein